MRETRTTDQLRDAIDHEQGADKVAFSDPDVVPLSTDDEASGHPPTREQVAAAHRSEIRQPAVQRPGLTTRFGNRTLYLAGAILLLLVITYLLR